MVCGPVDLSAVVLVGGTVVAHLGVAGLVSSYLYHSRYGDGESAFWTGMFWEFTMPWFMGSRVMLALHRRLTSNGNGTAVQRYGGDHNNIWGA